jgi:hypothetical protein
VIHQAAPSVAVGSSAAVLASPADPEQLASAPVEREAFAERAPEVTQPLAVAEPPSRTLFASPVQAPRAAAVFAATADASGDYAARYRGAREFLLARKAANGDEVTNGFGLTFAGQWYRGMFTPVELTQDGGAFVAFNERRRGLDFVPRLARLDASGATRWIAPLPELAGHTTYEVHGVYATADGGALAVYCPYRGQRPQSYVVVKLSAAGQIAWRAQMPQAEGYPVFLSRAQLDAAGRLEVTGHYQRLRSPSEELQGWRAIVTVDGRVIDAQRTGDLQWNINDRPNMHPSWFPVYRPYGQ